MDAPREDLIRSTPMLVAQTAFTRDSSTQNMSDSETVEGRTMTGYPIVYNQWAEIDSKWEGHFLERIHPGALNRTLKQRGDKVTVMFNHGFDNMIGNKPLGKPSLLESREFGLWAEVPLSRTSYNDDLIELMRDGALYGQSFRFRVLDERWDDKPQRSEHNPDGLPERTNMEIYLHEFGPVTFPAYEATTLGIRSVDAFDDWQRDRTPLLAFSTPADEGTVDDSPPLEVPVERKLVTLTGPRRAATMTSLSDFIQRIDP